MATIVASVDARRVAYIAKLLVAAGVESRRALPQAAFMYWAYLGRDTAQSRFRLSRPASHLHSALKLNPVEPPRYVNRMPGGVGGAAP